MEKFVAEGKAGQLQAVFHPAKEASSDFLIVCHPHPLYGGTMDNKVVTTIAKAYLDVGINVVRFNYRGVGESAGEYGHNSGEVEDALAIFTWLREHHSVKRLFLAGFSFGSYIAAQAAQSIADAGIEVPHLLMVAPSVENSPFELATPLAAPCTVIMGKQDEVVSFESVERWVNDQSEDIEMQVLPDATHFFHRQLIVLKNALASILSVF